MPRSLMSLAVLVWLLAWGRAGLAQVDERFEVFFELEGIECGGEIVAPAGTTVEVTVNVMLMAAVEGVSGMVIPVAATGADDTALRGCLVEDVICASKTVLGNEASGTEIWKYFFEFVDPNRIPDYGPIATPQGAGWILLVITNPLPANSFKLPAGTFLMGRFKALVTAPAYGSRTEVRIEAKNGLQGAGTPKTLFVTFDSASRTPVATTCTFTVKPLIVASVLPGDLNLDEVLDATDALALLDHYFRGEPSHLPCGDGTVYDPANLEFLDGNGDGAIDVSDAIYLLNNVFLGGSPHQSGAECTPIVGCPEVCSL